MLTNYCHSITSNQSNILYHFYRCFHVKVQNEMRELSTIRHSDGVCYDFGDFGNESKFARSQFFWKKKSSQSKIPSVLCCSINKVMSIYCYGYANLKKSRFSAKSCFEIRYYILSNALKKVHRLIRIEIWKSLLCSHLRPRRSIWRPDSESTWNSALNKFQTALEDVF